MPKNLDTRTFGYGSDREGCSSFDASETIAKIIEKGKKIVKSKNSSQYKAGWRAGLKDGKGHKRKAWRESDLASIKKLPIESKRIIQGYFDGYKYGRK